MLSDYNLPGQLSGEKVLKIVHRDLVIIFIKVFWFIFFGILPLALYFFLQEFRPDYFEHEIMRPILLLLFSGYYLFWWLLFFYNILDYLLDVWIITNERIIDIRQNGFFSRSIAELRLARIQDVASEVHGVLPTIFNYGLVRIQTAGEVERILLEQVPNPGSIRDLVIKIAEEKKHHAE